MKFNSLPKQTMPEQSMPCVPLDECLAKLRYDQDKPTKGLTVEQHCRVVGEVARSLVGRLPPWLHELFPKGVELVAAAHDVGKVNPMFQKKIYLNLLGNMSDVLNKYNCLRDINHESESLIGYHQGVSRVSLSRIDPKVAEIASCHHGSLPEVNLSDEDWPLGGVAWQQMREELLSSLKAEFETEWPNQNNISDEQSLVWSGIISVADWIGSGSRFEQLENLNGVDLKQLVDDALDEAGFIKPLVIRGLTFSDIFGFNPRRFQEAFIQELNQPGLYVIETLMGEGKTEAALFAAYKMLESGYNSGIYFALPTQLTSEKIYERFEGFLEKIIDKSTKHRAMLIHSNAFMYETNLGEDGRPGYPWFESGKRRLLAPFAVGTIDQALLSVMNVRHGFVRAFGLAGKVVILDEVHSYDAYTGTIMDHLIKTLLKLKCTVILLSATLIKSRKAQIISSEINQLKSAIDDYPLITKKCFDQISEIKTEVDAPEKKVQIKLHEIRGPVDEEQVFESVYERVVEGQFILWIENSVDKAQSVFRKLAAWGCENNIEVGLIHSRFPRFIRSKFETKWVEHFRYRTENKNRDLSGGKVLVGTQVLEQSLDIDCDFLITRLAPVDFIFQRIGRLWRHRQNDNFRPMGIKPEVWILHDVRDENFGPNGKVYSPYVLERSLEVLRNYEVLVLPKQIRILLEDCYSDRLENDQRMCDLKNELHATIDKLRRLAFSSLSKLNQPSKDDISTRYSEIESCRVLLIRSQPIKGDRGYNLRLIDDTELVLPFSNISTSQKKEIYKILSEHIINVPMYLAPDMVNSTELSWLKPYLYLDENFRVGILSDSGLISSYHLSNDTNPKNFMLYFDTELGYQAFPRHNEEKL